MRRFRPASAGLALVVSASWALPASGQSGIGQAGQTGSGEAASVLTVLTPRSALAVPGWAMAPSEAARRSVSATGSWHAPSAPLRPRQAPPPSIALATGASAVLPGAGQHLLGRDRKWVFLAVEALGWGFWMDRRARGGDFREQYRDFAWSEARIQASPRVDGDFDYYETLGKWLRSGSFDADAGAPGLQPEGDDSTFNGSIWSLARRIYLPGGPGTSVDDPQYQRALDYYRDRAYATELLWDWTGTGEARDTYAGLIEQSDRRFRQATNVLGAIIANHVVSAVDAFVTARGPAVPAEVRVVPSLAPRGTRWTTTLRWVTRP